HDAVACPGEHEPANRDPVERGEAGHGINPSMKNEDNGPLITLLKPVRRRANIEVLSAEPSGRDFQITIREGSKIQHMRASGLAGFINAETGEIIDDPVLLIREIWA